jgi:hypothetical protein
MHSIKWRIYEKKNFVLELSIKREKASVCFWKELKILRKGNGFKAWNCFLCVRFEIFTTVFMKDTIVMEVLLFSLLEVYWHLGGTYSLCLKSKSKPSRWWARRERQSELWGSEHGVSISSNTSVQSCQTTCHPTPVQTVNCFMFLSYSL